MSDPILEVVEGVEQLTQPVVFTCQPLSPAAHCEPVLANDWTGPFAPTAGGTGEQFSAFLHIRCDCHEILAPTVTLPEPNILIGILAGLLVIWLIKLLRED